MQMLAQFPEAIVFNKPAGLSCVTLSRSEPTAVSEACKQFPELSLVVTGAEGRPNEHGLLHRLDRDTSGCLAFARSQEAHVALRSTWKNAEKIYRAIVLDPQGFWIGRPLPLTLDLPMAASSKSSRRMLVLDPGRPGMIRSIKGSPLPAVTLILNATPIASLKDGFDLTLQIQTGVRHQIRAHLAASGTPLFRDPIYSKDPSGAFLLHAWKLTLPGLTSVEAPLPPGWPLS